MPEVYNAVMVEHGDLRWRQDLIDGTAEEGPEDQRFIIQLVGSSSSLSWLVKTSYGYAIDLDALAASCPHLFDKKWLRNKGLRKAIVKEIAGKFTIDVQV